MLLFANGLGFFFFCIPCFFLLNSCKHYILYLACNVMIEVNISLFNLVLDICHKFNFLCRLGMIQFTVAVSMSF